MNNTIKIISVYPNFLNKGGAQDVALQLAEKLNEEVMPVVLTETHFAEIVPDYWNRAKFVSFGWKAVRELANDNTVFLSHHRKSTSLLLLFSFLLRKKLHIVHVAHNTFNNLRFFSFFPKTVVAVSNGVKENLINYFHVPASHIIVVFNGIKDFRNDRNVKADKSEIHILLSGRICTVKQQVEIVRQTRGKLAAHIHIFFAGTGSDLEVLKKEIENESQYHYIGFVDIEENLNRYDYVCLFSQKEGLPLSLIEGCMFGKPLITNNLSAVLDVNEAGETGFVFPDFGSLIQGLNNLPMPYSEEYRKLSLNARLKYEKVFTEERMIKKYKEIIFA
ncbi:glycosyltransferase family 4 protein [Bacteroides fluxus]|uniref:glycosyltransferase family 4 protein n=1 Tax=Bacteroides fluxus TaxID=626930 RepID=UPI0023EF9747|nr:glycosyltransferase family 4 protein [Bacteroides fluxus]